MKKIMSFQDFVYLVDKQITISEEPRFRCTKEEKERGDILC